jgi:hypothetical protein
MNFEIAPKSTEIKATWDAARLYCFSLNIDSKTGWRLPTIEELDKIYQSQNDFEKWWYWSSTEDNGYGALTQLYGLWVQAGSYKSLDNIHVRAVRTIP